MNPETEYCVEYKPKGRKLYHKSFWGYHDKELALGIAKVGSEILDARVIEQKRKVIKVFKKGI